MTNFRMLVTNEGTHPATKWADLAVDEIMEISAQAPEALLREATEFRTKLHNLLTNQHDHAMKHEIHQCKAGHHHMHLPYETEGHACDVVEEIVGLANGTSFQNHFEKENVQTHLKNVCNHYFQSARHVERQHFNARPGHVRQAPKKGKKSS